MSDPQGTVTHTQSGRSDRPAARFVLTKRPPNSQSDDKTSAREVDPSLRTKIHHRSRRMRDQRKKKNKNPSDEGTFHCEVNRVRIGKIPLSLDSLAHGF
ncbi:hypothetical protein [Paraburkholderia sabiae]|uniref:hypothetical protein n=1 Tax=Paraburkholderia sabiae TaxID=273251 RepID=UPI001CC6C7B2|nr:hypothetical protein [Paraburkholderia sabiae]